MVLKFLMKTIIGLGNPGAEYANTRHNIGFMFLDHLREEWGFESFKDSKFKGMISEGNHNGERFILLKPFTYMNLSGESVSSVLNFYKLDHESEMIVITDDISMEFGKLRFRSVGSAGGHNGLKSIIRSIGSETFPRIKIGVGQDKKYNTSDWVLSRFDKLESESIKAEIFPQALDLLESKIIP